MGYRVDYQPIRKVRGVQKQKRGIPALAAAFFLLFLLLVNSAWPQGRDALQKLLFSGDMEATSAALEILADELKAGEALDSALQTFCRSVIREAEVDPG